MKNLKFQLVAVAWLISSGPLWHAAYADPVTTAKVTFAGQDYYSALAYLYSFVWAPGKFKLPTRSQNVILSGAFHPDEDYVYGFLVLEGVNSTFPAKLITRVHRKVQIEAIGWIRDSHFSFGSKDIFFLGPSGISVGHRDRGDS
jgi:hypothetical protein